MDPTEFDMGIVVELNGPLKARSQFGEPEAALGEAAFGEAAFGEAAGGRRRWD